MALSEMSGIERGPEALLSSLSSFKLMMNNVRSDAEVIKAMKDLFTLTKYFRERVVGSELEAVVSALIRIIKCVKDIRLKEEAIDSISYLIYFAGVSTKHEKRIWEVIWNSDVVPTLLDLIKNGKSDDQKSSALMLLYELSDGSVNSQKILQHHGIVLQVLLGLVGFPSEKELDYRLREGAGHVLVALSSDPVCSVEIFKNPLVFPVLLKLINFCKTSKFDVPLKIIAIHLLDNMACGSLKNKERILQNPDVLPALLFFIKTHTDVFLKRAIVNVLKNVVVGSEFNMQTIIGCFKKEIPDISQLLTAMPAPPPVFTPFMDVEINSLSAHPEEKDTEGILP